MLSSAERLAAELSDLRRRLAALERGSQLTRSTVGTPNGTVSVTEGLSAGMAASAAAAEALERAANAAARADGAVHTYFGSEAPENVKLGDLWRDDEGTVSQWDGEDWVALTDPELSATLSSLSDAVDGKVTIFYAVSGTPPADANEGDLWIVTNKGHLMRRWDGTDWLDCEIGTDAIATGAVTSNELGNNAVTAAKLESNLVLASRIVAGPPTETHAEMDSTGLRVFASDPVEGGTSEVIRLGVSETDDYFSVAQPDGSLTASVSQYGTMSATNFSVRNSLYYRGQELQDWRDTGPRGIVAYATRTNHDPNDNARGGGAAKPYLRLDTTLYKGRLYRVSTSPIRAGANSGTIGQINLGYNKNAPADVYNRSIFCCARPMNGEGDAVVLSELFALGDNDDDEVVVSFLIDYVTVSGNEFGIRASGQYPVRLIVEDIGPLGAQRSIHLGSSTPTPALQVPTTTVVAANSIKNFKDTFLRSIGGNTQNIRIGTPFDAGDTYSNSCLYQGMSPDGDGVLVGYAYFPDLTVTLSGRTIEKMEVSLSFDTWYHNSGGTAYIAMVQSSTYISVGSAAQSGYTYPNGDPLPSDATILHGTTNLNQNTNVVESGGWPRPGKRWVPIPAKYYNGWQTGQYRGIALVGDGTYDTYGRSAPDRDPDGEQTAAAMLRITYT